MEKYLSNLLNTYNERYFYQKEYLDVLTQFINSIKDDHDLVHKFKQTNFLENFFNPNRIITFKVPWYDDSGNLNINTGYRVQHSNALGIYKGGIRFHKTVNESVLKMLAFEQTLKNSLTNLPLGGAKGGSDFDPMYKSKAEKRRFSESFMIELNKYIGPNIDVPAGDLGVSGDEIAYMYSIYKRITNKTDGVLTSKHHSFGGSLLRPESTGYGIAYVTNKILDLYFKEKLLNKKIVISGTGQVGFNTALKVKELGGTIIAISNIDGVIYNEDGIDLNILKNILDLEININNYLDSYPDTIFYEDIKKLWTINADILIPCATQFEINEDDALNIIKNKPMLVVEGSNKPTTSDAANILKQNNILVVPSKAANSGGVIVSNFEMIQNSTFTKWTSSEVDLKLKIQMETIIDTIYNEATTLNDINNLEKASNIVSIKRLYEAIRLL